MFALLLFAGTAQGDGISNPTASGIYGLGGGANQFDGGVSSGASASSPATPCSGTGLIFTVACNSQYVGLL